MSVWGARVRVRSCSAAVVGCSSMILCYDGLPGSGKSYAMVERACRMVEEARKDYIVANFPPRFGGLVKYAARKGYGRVVWLALRERWLVTSKLSELLAYGNSVALFDEAAVFANGRDWNSLPKEFVADLAQSRKGGVDLIWASQDMELVDKTIRSLTFLYYACRRAGSLYARFHYKPADYARVRAGDRAWWKRLCGFELGRFDAGVFGSYDSFARLDGRELRVGPPGPALGVGPLELRDRRLRPASGGVAGAGL